MKNEHQKSTIELIGQWIRHSIILKAMLIFILMLMLMIPMSYIRVLIHEREDLRQTTIHEVSDAWAGEQCVFGPILTIPFQKNVFLKEGVKEVREEVHILPVLLTIDGEIDPKSLHRGIYEVVVYNSRLSFEGNFSNLEKHFNNVETDEILWDEAFLTINISDLRGIKEEIAVKWNGIDKPVEPGSRIPRLIKSGITVNHIFTETQSMRDSDFSFDLHLQGSQQLYLVPLGIESQVYLASDWNSPGFTGSFLPDKRTVSDTGFTASYKILKLNRNFPQSWTGDEKLEEIEQSAFGVDLLLPVDDYHKTMRSAKYALLVFSLTFLTFFLVEVISNKELHPFQYALIGLALCLFYTLLISISEQTNFTTAYLISSLVVIVMIGFYARSILKNVMQTVVLMIVLCLVYTFVFITLQVQEYALLIGSVGLTLILAFTMYITRNIDWYELNSGSEMEEI